MDDDQRKAMFAKKNGNGSKPASKDFKLQKYTTRPSEMPKFKTEKKEWNIAVFSRIALENGMDMDGIVDFIKSNIPDVKDEEIANGLVNGVRITKRD
jgi:hypothetical protein